MSTTTLRSRRLLTFLATGLAVAAPLGLAACGSDETGDGSNRASSVGTTAPNAKERPQTQSNADKAIVKDAANSGKTVTIGSKNFTEEYILGQIYAQALKAAGFTVKTQLNLGSEQIALKAVKDGTVDAYPEYTGTALISFFKVPTDDIPKDADAAYEETKTKLASDGLTALPQTPYTNSNAVAITKATQEKLGGITKISELAGKTDGLTLSGTTECRRRNDCLKGLQDEYGLKFGKFLPVDPALRHEVLTKKQADLSIVYSTDGQIEADDLVVLEDDKHIFPPYNVTLITKTSALEAAGDGFAKVIAQVQQDLTDENVRELNSRVDLDKETPEKAAADYLSSFGYVAKG